MYKDTVALVCSIVPVAPGLFRNYWLPKRWASYLSVSASKPKDIVAERDFSFGAHSKDTITPPNDPSQANAPQERKEGNKSVTTAAARAARVSPERATEILDEQLPSQILFYRVPITEPSSATTTETTPSPNPTTEQRRQHASPAAAALAAASSPTSPPIDVGHSLHAEPIFGSVSTSDIADSIKALLAQDEEGARIVLSAEEVTILTSEGVEGGDRVKALGEFPIEVKMRGGRDTVRRIVSVTAVEDEN
ncbi:MAG: Fructose-bisphosphate aldolase 1 [Ramalina farinacea]|uniref:Fructose-bisphosphate aldolase 1 n=1 Tax=Ramalina farinacea TaxID=258253 RepID=A0AA43QWG7_9LECA|nr:Fructose-bisphosphate aldolase 1 [Ramalina farinacea]